MRHDQGVRHFRATRKKAAKKQREDLASSKPGYGKNATWMDCYGCHQGGVDQGPSLFDAIHSAHYPNTTFVDELKGNCFSCHALNSKGEYVVWDLYRYGSEFGGMLNSGSQNIQDWVGNRGFSQDTIAGITLQSNMAVELTDMSQPESSIDDHFSTSNHAVPEFDVENWTLKIKGVNTRKRREGVASPSRLFNSDNPLRSLQTRRAKPNLHALIESVA